MQKSPRGLTLRILNLISFIITVAINGLGSRGYLSKDGLAVGAVSNKFATKITPAGYAFSIWALIYILLACFCIWSLFPSQRSNELIDEKIGWWFIMSNIANCLWITIWVQGEVWAAWVSSFMLFAIVFFVVGILMKARCFQDGRDSLLDFIFVDVAFSIYGGWVTAASIVNLSAALTASGWDGKPWTMEGWSVLMAFIAAIIYLAVLYTKKNVAFALVYIWAVVAIIMANKDSQMIVIGDSILVSIVGLACIVQFTLNLRSRSAWKQIA